mmetsp:Transcript_93821/g.209648  ORF Transcript_93821/g.209648 Transcript_93821/m.209648 type:complete len:223 (-) Transcript_93821:324-992(-)
MALVVGRQGLIEVACHLGGHNRISIAADEQHAALPEAGERGTLLLLLAGPKIVDIERSVQRADTFDLHHGALEAVHLLAPITGGPEVSHGHLRGMDRHGAAQGMAYEEYADLSEDFVILHGCLTSLHERIMQHAADAPDCEGHRRPHERPRAAVAIYIHAKGLHEPLRDCREQGATVEVGARLAARADSPVHAREEEGDGACAFRMPRTEVPDALDPRALEL